MSYPVTATLSVEAVHESVTELWVILDAVKLVGAVGAWVSGGGRVVTFNVLLFVELPATSLAWIKNP